MDRLRRWQFEVREYEAETGENITDRTKCAVVLRWAPLEVRDILRRSAASVLDNFDELVKTLEDYRVRSQTFQHATVTSMPTPMEVDAMWSYWKGGGKGRDKGKGKDKGK